ncbi:uncharacterized protein FOBCDRAFT_137889 [Fusarium oxysporum Fo47]|uniref:uncharacterized protein n=1 Tax=Fusarium oxysporum Fo47 TaxID=660027 RepID=UPI002869900A|nr:uncharacterized protein FOBCDRAFT_137889 [Fusarium oxysporum Fo47]WJG35455.1 hypothetical protein FOBCDRAFT_137889 [Fusarium oxysporum Fo47]
MSRDEPSSNQLAGLGSRKDHYLQNLILKVEISQLQTELVNLENILLAHKQCCSSPQACTHSL